MRVHELVSRGVALSLLLCFAAPARAADLRWTAPDDCQRASNVAAQVEGLVGQPLHDVGAVDFEVSVQHVASATAPWTLVVRTLLRDAAAIEPRTRELSGASCAEVTDAAAVAIAMVVQEQAEAAVPEPVPEPTAATRVVPAPAATQPVTARDSQPASPSAAPPAPSDALKLRFGVGLGVVLDTAALPAPAPGGQLEVSLGVSALRASLLGTLFAPQETTLSGDERGGEFQFALAGVLVCGAPAFGSVRVLGCAGFELGQMTGEGKHVGNATARSAGWQAIRAEVGLAWEFVPRLGLTARAGLVPPFSRPDFVLDGKSSVHRPAALTTRILLGIEAYL